MKVHTSYDNHTFSSNFVQKKKKNDISIALLSVPAHVILGMTADTVKPVCDDHIYNKIYYLWFIQ